MNNSANREHHKGDEYIIDEINPVPRRKKLRRKALSHYSWS